MKMTKEEAIKELNEVKLYFDADDKIQQALTLAIQSLESNYCNNSNSSREVSDEYEEFMKNNRVEVHFDASQQYLCYINYKEGDGAYGLGMTFMESLTNGIYHYKKMAALPNVKQ